MIKPCWIKMKHLCHYICLISCTNILQSYDYLVSSFIQCYLFFVIFSNKIYALVNFKIVLKNFFIKILSSNNMAWKCSKNEVHKTRPKCVTYKLGFVNITSFYINLLRLIVQFKAMGILNTETFCTNRLKVKLLQTRSWKMKVEDLTIIIQTLIQGFTW